MIERIGELAAFGTAIGWTVSALFFEQSIKRIGVMAVNFYKVVLAFILLALTAAIMRGMPLPLDAPPKAWIFVSLSGLFGFVIAVFFLFSAYRTIGPRITMLFMALSPPITAGIAYFFLGEAIGSRGFLGMSLVIIGICTTIFGRMSGTQAPKASFFSLIKKESINKEDRKGYLFAFLASVGQSIGMNLTKIGIRDYDPVSGTQIRSLVAILGFAIAAIVIDRGCISKAIKNVEGLKFMAIGAVFGPFLGSTLTLFALKRVSAGIVSSIIGLTPVLIIVPELLFLKKKIKPLEIIGAVIAVCGTSVFFL
jgi:drug/metabolite transporter (DMT)-like permease